MFMSNKKYIFLLVLSLCGWGSVHAQSLGSQPDPVQYIVAPETPGPNQFVHIEVEGVGSFLGNAMVTWQKDGKVVTSGTGVTTYSFTTGGVGSNTRITVVINSAIHGTITRDFVFAPSLVNLVWEAQTTVPQQYLGKALYSAGSSVQVVAFPTIVVQGTKVPNNKLSFQWSREGNIVPDQSGLGKNVFSFTGDQLKNGETVAVDVYIGGTKVGRSEIYIPATTPKIVLYTYDPLRGLVFDSALVNAVNLGGKEVTLQAEPYYFALSSRQKGALAFTWALNGEETTGPDSARGFLTLRQTGSGAGAAKVEVSVQNTESDKFIQAAGAGLILAFGQQAGSFLSTLFGI